MDEREPILNGDPDERASLFGWKAPAVALAIVVWTAFRPPVPLWLYVLCWAAALAAADGVARLLRHRGPAPRRGGPIPAPDHLAAHLPRLGPDSWLLDPRWTRARTAAAGFLVFATLAGIMGWNAAQEYRMLATLRDQGRRTEATVVEITGRTEEGRPAAVTVRFETPSGPVQADVDVTGSAASEAKPGARIPVAYDPATPTQVVQVDYLDGRDAAGMREGSIVIGLLAAGFLAGATWEAVRARRRTNADTAPHDHRT
ncbi:DUF3592 domain-containing protein [Streptomyces sp. NPDC015139]|uniref:DUF3592 domain-containing protein n=1 Tax=Streptomyces sp. NPDC015139 TaxID=3364942 RepID=UPI0036FAE337